MNKSKFTEKHISFVLEQVQNGSSIVDVCKVIGISQATFYNWRNRYGQNEIASSKRLSELEDENIRLKEKIRELEKDKRMLLSEFSKRR